MMCSAKREALLQLKKAAKKLIADGYGDDEEAGAKLMADSKKGELADGMEDDDEADENEEGFLVEDDEDEDLSDLEEEALSFLGRGGHESPMAAGQTRVVFQIESPKKGRRGKA